MKIRAALALVVALLASSARADVLTYTLSGIVENAQSGGLVNGDGVANGDSVSFQISYDTSIAYGDIQSNPISTIYDSTAKVSVPTMAAGTVEVPPDGSIPFIQASDPLGSQHIDLYLQNANWPASGSLADVRLDQLGYSSFDLQYAERTPTGQATFDVVGGPFQAAAARAPEPASLTLLAVGALGMAWRMRRRQTAWLARPE